jgi:hypothetical protein
MDGQTGSIRRPAWVEAALNRFKAALICTIEVHRPDRIATAERNGAVRADIRLRVHPVVRGKTNRVAAGGSNSPDLLGGREPGVIGSCFPEVVEFDEGEAKGRG